MTTDPVALPDDEGKSRLHRGAEAPKPNDDDIVRASDRFASFRRKHKGGFHDATLERLIEHPDGALTYVVRAEVWKVWPSSEAPDATAWAQGSTSDTNPIIAAAPLESADTIARSRALRNLGILPNPTKAKRT